MKLFILVAVIAIARAKIIEDCSGIIVHGIKHEKEILKSNVDSPYQLVIDYDTSTLFFSYSTQNADEPFKSAYLNLKTNEFGLIDGITGGFANAVDQKSHTVYLGGNDGIYTFNYNTKKAVHAGARDVSIWQLFYKDRLYYTDYPNEIAYTFEYGTSTKVPELDGSKVVLLAIDKNNNIVFSNSSGLYVYKKDKSKTDFLGDYTLNSLTADINGNLYFSTPDSIFFLDEKSEKITKLTETDTIYGVVIEDDNSIIYADNNHIIRLKPTKSRCSIDFDKTNN